MKVFLFICSAALILILLQDLPCTSGAKKVAKKKMPEKNMEEDEEPEDEEADDEEPEKEMTCEKMMSDMKKKQETAIAACVKKMKFTCEKEKAKKWNCVIKCAMKKEKLLDGDGQMPMKVLKKYIQKEFPSHCQPKAKALYGKCQKTTTAHLNDDDEYCKSYGPLIKCETWASELMCKEKD